MAGCAPTPEVGRSPGTAPTFATRAGRGVATSCHTSVGVCRRPSPSVTSSMRQWRLHDPFLTPRDNLMTVHHHKCQQNVCRVFSVLRPGRFLCGRGQVTRAGTGLLSPTASNAPGRKDTHLAAWNVPGRTEMSPARAGCAPASVRTRLDIHSVDT